MLAAPSPSESDVRTGVGAIPPLARWGTLLPSCVSRGSPLVKGHHLFASSNSSVQKRSSRSFPNRRLAR